MARWLIPFALLSVFCLGAAAEAQPCQNAAWFNIGGGGTHDSDHSGGALSTGLSAQISRVFATFTPVDLILSKGDSSPYYRDTFGNGGSACRNSLNGEFAEDSKCIAISVAYAFSADIAVLIPQSPVLLGAGVRHGRRDNPWFVVAGFQHALSPMGLVTCRVNAGPDYVSGIVGLSVRLGRR